MHHVGLAAHNTLASVLFFSSTLGCIVYSLVRWNREPETGNTEKAENLSGAGEVENIKE